MQYIDTKFKDNDPKSTVKKIQEILSSLGITLQEYWNDAGVEHCYSVHVFANQGLPATNGKGVSKELARASAYAEFMERLASGSFIQNHHYFDHDSRAQLHAYAPDHKYMTVEDMVTNGQWMDHIIESYPQYHLNRQIIAEHCAMYDGSADGRVLTVPFYSLFEDKYVYLPVSYVNRMYSANGHCAGNSREEAWIHALSEIMERYASQNMVRYGENVPEIPRETLNQFPVVSKIIEQLESSGNFDVSIRDCSMGNGFPVLCSRIIDKRNQAYLVNVGADPVLEIAAQRTLTEVMQGRNVRKLHTVHSNKILAKITDFPVELNVVNHLLTSDAMYTADFFADDPADAKQLSIFPDNSKKSNTELLSYMLSLYRDLGKPIYIRNYSYLGFPVYKLVVPGFSETHASQFAHPIPERYIAESLCPVYADPSSASKDDLLFTLQYSDTIRGCYSRYNHFSVNAGMPIFGTPNHYLTPLTRAYAAYSLQDYDKTASYLLTAINHTEENSEIRQYLKCVHQFLQMQSEGIPNHKIRSILYKFYAPRYPDELFSKLDNDLHPLENYVLHCDRQQCENCRYRTSCDAPAIIELVNKVGAVYSTFTNGQDPSEFAI